MVEEDGIAPTPGVEDPPSGDTARILEAITLCQTTLSSKIEKVEIDISLIHQDIHKLRERVTEMKCRIGHLEDEILPLQVTASGYSINSMLS